MKKLIILLLLLVSVLPKKAYFLIGFFVKQEFLLNMKIKIILFSIRYSS
jgi:hypothetical protein